MKQAVKIKISDGKEKRESAEADDENIRRYK